MEGAPLFKGGCHNFIQGFKTPFKGTSQSPLHCKCSCSTRPSFETTGATSSKTPSHGTTSSQKGWDKSCADCFSSWSCNPTCTDPTIVNLTDNIHCNHRMYYAQISCLATCRLSMVQPLFVDPRPGPVLDLEPRSGPGPVQVQTQTPVLQCNYFYFYFLSLIFIYI